MAVEEGHMDSILVTIKKMLGIDDSYEHFDTDIIVNINTIFMMLNQLGIGPTNGFSIKDKSSIWDDYISVDYLNMEAVKTYIYLRVRLLFDPPTNAFLVEAIKSQIKEIEWRLNVQAEGGE